MPGLKVLYTQSPLEPSLGTDDSVKSFIVLALLSDFSSENEAATSLLVSSLLILSLLW